MLETKFKIAFLLVVLAFAAIPIMGILRGTIMTPYETVPEGTEDGPSEPESAANEEPLPEEMVTIPGGPFVRGTTNGGFDEQPPDRDRSHGGRAEGERSYRERPAGTRTGGLGWVDDGSTHAAPSSIADANDPMRRA